MSRSRRHYNSQPLINDLLGIGADALSLFFQNAGSTVARHIQEEKPHLADYLIGSADDDALDALAEALED